MNKQEVLALMAELAEKFNRDGMTASGMSPAEVNDLCEKTRPSILLVNGAIYDMLLEKNIING